MADIRHEEHDEAGQFDGAQKFVEDTLLELIETEPDQERREKLQSALAAIALIGGDAESQEELDFEFLGDEAKEFEEPADSKRAEVVAWLLGNRRTPRRQKLLETVIDREGEWLPNDMIIDEEPELWGDNRANRESQVTSNAAFVRDLPRLSGRLASVLNVTAHQLRPGSYEALLKEYEADRIAKELLALDETTKVRLASLIDRPEEAAFFSEMLNYIGTPMPRAEIMRTSKAVVSESDDYLRSAAARILGSLRAHPQLGRSIRSFKYQHAEQWCEINPLELSRVIENLGAIERAWFLDLDPEQQAVLMDLTASERQREILRILLANRGGTATRSELMAEKPEAFWGQEERARNQNFTTASRFKRSPLQYAIRRTGQNGGLWSAYYLDAYSARAILDLHEAKIEMSGPDAGKKVSDAANLAAHNVKVFSKDGAGLEVGISRPLALAYEGMPEIRKRIVRALVAEPWKAIGLPDLYEAINGSQAISEIVTLQYWQTHFTDLRRLEERGFIAFVRKGQKVVGVQAC